MTKTDPKKRILLLDPASFIGGAERFALDLANQVDLETFELWVAHGKNPNYKKELLSGIRDVELNVPQLRLKNIFSIFAGIRRLRKILKKNKIQLLQTNSVRAHIVGSLAANGLRVKVVWFLHDFTFPGKLIRYFSKFPKRILCCSDAVKNHVDKQIPAKFKPKLGRFLNGIDLTLIEKEWLSDHIMPPPVVGIVGRIDRWKGQRYFVEAAEKVAKKNPGIQFFIIGEPNQLDEDNVQYSEELKTMVQTKNLEKTVIFRGHRSPIFKEISQLSLLIHCSTDPEPFGRTIIEAMAMGKVVIATNHGGPVESVIEGETGHLIPPKNAEELAQAIITCLGNHERMKKMGKNAKKIATEKYELSKTVKAVEEVWMGVLNV